MRFTYCKHQDHSTDYAMTKDICRTELTSVMIKMQQDMIEKLQNLLLSTSSPEKTIDYDAIFNTSTQAKLNSISSLAQQYQRFSTAAPIVRLPQSLPIAHNNRPEYCAGALALQSGTSRISIDWKCDPCGFSMLPWGPRPPKGKTKPLYPPTWAVGCAGMTWVFSYAQHLPIDTTDRTPGRVMVYRQCIICWAVEGVVSKKLGREEWLAHMNEHFMSGGYEMCRNKAGTQLRKRNCGVRTCKKIHSVG